MAERMALVARELNKVQSVGQAVAAVSAAETELGAGRTAAMGLNPWTSPTPEEAYQNIATIQAALAGEKRAMAHRSETAPIDLETWPRTRRQIERAYNEVAGIEGVSGAVDRIDTVGILARSIAEAPKVFLEAAGQAAGTVVSTAAGAAGAGVGGLFSGLGWFGTMVVVLVLLVVLGGPRLLARGGS